MSTSTFTNRSKRRSRIVCRIIILATCLSSVSLFETQGVYGAKSFGAHDRAEHVHTIVSRANDQYTARTIELKETVVPATADTLSLSQAKDDFEKIIKAGHSAKASNHDEVLAKRQSRLLQTGGDAHAIVALTDNHSEIRSETYVLPGDTGLWSQFAKTAYEQNGVIVGTSRGITHYDRRHNTIRIALDEFLQPPGENALKALDRASRPAQTDAQIETQIRELAGKGHVPSLSPERIFKKVDSASGEIIPEPQIPTGIDDPKAGFARLAAAFGIEEEEQPQRKHVDHVVDNDGKRIEAIDLLPDSVRSLDLYGYTDSDASQKLMCHMATILITRPELLDGVDQSKKDWLKQLLTSTRLDDDYFENTYEEIGPDVAIEANDIALIYSYYPGEMPEDEYHLDLQHSVALLPTADRLLAWNKNGDGAHNALFLKPWSEVLEEWATPYQPGHSVKTIVKFMRSPHS